MAKILERETRDVDKIKFIKDGVDQLLVKNEKTNHICREYFDKLFNEECESSLSLNWTTPLMIQTGVLCGELRSQRSKRL